MSERERRRRTLDPRMLHVKVRVIPQRPTTRAEILDVVREAAQSGTIRAGFVIKWVDWRKGDEEEGEYNAGRLIGAKMRKALREFYDALMHANTTVRVERPED